MRKGVFWCPSPDTDDTGTPVRDYEWLSVRRADDWYAIDGDRLVLPVVKLGRSGESSDGVTKTDERSGLLVQYGGSDLMLDILEAGIEEGDEFSIVNPADGRPFLDAAQEMADDLDDD